MKILVGLGNPGQTYHGTRHNVGFMVVQLLADRRRVPMRQRVVSQADARPASVYGEYRDGAHTVRLVMPLTMMNESGGALRALSVEPSRVLIVCDDVNLPLGTIRLRAQGSAGGHHGLQSCLEALGTDLVPRLRVGVSREPLPRDLHDFVLSRFSSAERPAVKRAVDEAAEACEVWVRDGIDIAMNRYNKVQDQG